MRHTDDNLFDPERAAAFDDLLKRRYKAFAAIQAKALGAHVFDVKEFFKAFCLDHLIQDCFAAFTGEGNFLIKAFDAFFQPCRLLGIRYMHVLQGKRAAIGAFDDVDDLPHGGNLQPKYIVNENRPIHICLGETIGLRIKLGMFGFFTHAERVKIGGQMATNAVGTNDHQGANTVQNRPFDCIITDFCARFGRFVRDFFSSPLCLGRYGPHAI